MPILTFKSDRPVRTNEPAQLLDLDESRTSQAGLNPHLKNFIDASSSKPRQLTLLKLNYDQQQRVQVEIPQRDVSQRARSKSPERPKQPIEVKSVGVEVEKPLYDGYILAPDVFKDLLENEPQVPRQTSAEAHFKATEYLRDKPKKKTETRSTMTETKSHLQVRILF